MKKKNPSLSFDQKKIKLLQIIHDMKDVTNLKELEKSIKDVLDSLVGDSLVENDKIGSANFIWSLPSNRVNTLSNSITEKEAKIEDTLSQMEVYHLKIDTAQQNRQPCSQRTLLLQEYDSLMTTIRMHNNTLKDKQHNDPRRYHTIKNTLKQQNNLLETITDDIYQVKKWMMTTNPNLQHKQLNDYFQIPEDIDDQPTL